MSDHLAVPADLLSIRAVGPWIRDCLRGHVDAAELEPVAARAELALQEIAANIVSHGYGARAGIIELSADVLPGDPPAWMVEVVDDGDPYEPDAQPEPSPDVPQVHGYGLMIVRQLTRDFAYERCDDRNHTTLVFDLPSHTKRMTP